MNLAKFAIEHPPLTWLSISLIILIGGYNYLNFPSQEDPAITFRTILIITENPGMSPNRVEHYITKPIEEALRKVPQIRDLKSTSKTGMSVIQARVGDVYFDIDPIWQDVRNKIDDIKPLLPAGTRSPIIDDDYGRVDVAIICLTGNDYTNAELFEQAEDIRVNLYKVPGTKIIDIHGQQKQAIYLQTSDARLRSYGITPIQLIDSLKKRNIIVSGGLLEILGNNVIIEPSGNYKNLSDIKKTAISVPNSNQTVLLGDILTVSKGYESPAKKKVICNKESALALGISMKDGENIIDFGERIKAKVAEINSALPVGMTLSYAAFQPELVKRSINNFSLNLYETVGIVLGVVLLALGIRTGMIVGLIVPLTFLLAIIIMQQVGILLHRVSIASLIISLGLLIDNGIVMGEDIQRRMALGQDRKSAAIDASGGLARPLLVSSLTTILAFIPLMMSDHVSSEYTKSIPQVIMITLLSSWFLAMFATPFLCYKFLKVKANSHIESQAGTISQFYECVLKFALKHKVVSLLLFLFVVCLCFWSKQFVPKQFFPESQRNQYIINLDLPTGSSLDNNQQQINELLTWLDKHPQVNNVIAYVGYGGPRFYLTLYPREPDSYKTFILVDTDHDANVSDMILETQQYLYDNQPYLVGDVKKLWYGTTETGDISIRIIGKDITVLESISSKIKEALYKLPGTKFIQDDWGNKTVKLVARIDQDRAQRANITSEDVAASLRAFVSGSSVSNFRGEGLIVPIVIRASDNERNDRERLRTVNVYSLSTGKAVPLLQVADLVPVYNYANIKHRELERAMTVSGKNKILPANVVQEYLEPVLNSLELPSGYRWEWGGEIESAGDAEKALSKYVPFALMIILMLLVWQFNSFRKPLIIFVSIPLGFAGAIVGLNIMHAYYGFMASLGFLSLAGVIINNAIVYLDRLKIDEDANMPIKEAIIATALNRLRPIMLTTLTTCFGMLPLFFFGGPFWYAMSVVIIFGLLLGALATLFVVPLMYSLFYNIKFKE